MEIWGAWHICIAWQIVWRGFLKLAVVEIECEFGLEIIERLWTLLVGLIGIWPIQLMSFSS